MLDPYHVNIFYELVQIGEPLCSIFILEISSHCHHYMISLVMLSLDKVAKIVVFFEILSDHVMIVHLYLFKCLLYEKLNLFFYIVKMWIFGIILLNNIVLRCIFHSLP